MKKYINIIADYNDGDYCESLIQISDEILEIIKPLIEEIKNYKGDYNWDNHNNEMESPEDFYVKGGLCTQEAFNAFGDIMPYAPENDEIHSITSIRILEVSNESQLL